MSMLSRFARNAAETLTTEQLEAIVAKRNAQARAEMFEAAITVLDDSQRYVRTGLAEGISWLASAIAPSK